MAKNYPLAPLLISHAKGKRQRCCDATQLGSLKIKIAKSRPLERRRRKARSRSNEFSAVTFGNNLQVPLIACWRDNIGSLQMAD